MEPKLTICIPAYKAVGTIGKTLESLMIQTDPDFNVMVVEDGPDPELHAKIMEYADRLNLTAVKLKKNGGCGHARNVGLDKCKTEYIAYLDADDLYMPYAVDHINQAIKMHFDWYAGKFIQRSSRGYIIRGNEHNTWCHGRVYNMGFLKYHKLRFPEGMKLVDDTPFNILCREFGVEVRESDLPIAQYMPNEKSATRQEEAHQIQASEYIEGMMHYVRIAMRGRPANQLKELPQVIVMCFFYLDYARYKGWSCTDKMERDYQELCAYIDLKKLLEDEKYLSWLKAALLIPNRPYPDVAEPLHETFWEMMERLHLGVWR